MEEKSFYSFAAKFVLNDYTGLLRKFDKTRDAIPAFVLGPMVRLNYEGVIDRKQLRQAVEEILRGSEAR